MQRFLLHSLFFLLTLLGTQRINAHQVELIYLEIDSTETDRWQAIVFFDAGYALPEMRADISAPQPKREWLLAQSDTQLDAIRRGAEDYIRECLVFKSINFNGTTQLNYTVDFPDFETDPPSFPRMLTGGAYLHVRLTGAIPTGELQLQVSEGERPSFTVDFKDNASVVTPGNHLSLFTKLSGSNTAEVVDLSLSEKIWSFFKLGFAHVLPDGLDHILFIIGLFIAALKLRALIHLSLMFTIAHSLTLGLMLVGIIQLSDSAIAYVVEPIIALSIAWIALEHLFWKKKTKRIQLAVVFVFGLIHGLGFASSLRQGLQMDNGWAVPLISANVGIEIAQLLLLAACVMLFHRHLNTRWFSQLRTVTSIAIGAVGIWWFISRLFGI